MGFVKLISHIKVELYEVWYFIVYDLLKRAIHMVQCDTTLSEVIDNLLSDLRTPLYLSHGISSLSHFISKKIKNK